MSQTQFERGNCPPLRDSELGQFARPVDGETALVSLPRLRHLTVRSSVREFALEYSAERRRLSSGQPRFTRVSEAWLDQVEARVKAMVRAHVDSLPSVGRTI